MKEAMDKGTFSNCLSAAVLGVSLVLPEGVFRALLFSTGMYAFSGGITNWLAVKMLFDRIPGLIGSGVIPARFREIRSKVKNLILEHFFNPEYLEQFFADHAQDIDWQSYVKKASGGAPNPIGRLVEKEWDKLTAKDVVQPVIDAEIEKLTDSPIGGFLLMVGTDNIRPAVNQFVTAFVASMESKVSEFASNLCIDKLEIELDKEKILKDVQAQLDFLLERKLLLLDASHVKRMMEDVIRQHLGWLVVWGNVFGAILGLIAFGLQPYVSG